jgi:effector-binding domain-containing protein
MSLPTGGPIRVEITQVRPQNVASVRQTITRDEMTETLGRMFQEVAAVLARQGVGPSGPRFARWHTFGDVIDLEAGMPVAAPIRPEGNVQADTLPGGPTAHAIHMGSYERLEAAYRAISDWIERTGRRPGEGPWETYTTDPTTEPDPERWRTDIHWPLVIR